MYCQIYKIIILLLLLLLFFINIFCLILSFSWSYFQENYVIQNVCLSSIYFDIYDFVLAIYLFC